ncbi:hypothetical protein [Enterobacter roggenkampii]|uniref:hypothetical protein n=1 Tax=Enterobacter roggenkampii TaxID=1812935 RepID=UPI0021A4D935|nr:hypothetical protein [Enterobacter roggenkampii]
MEQNGNDLQVLTAKYSKSKRDWREKVALAIDYLSRNQREVTYSEITTIVCLDHRLVKRAVAQWEKRTDKNW